MKKIVTQSVSNSKPPKIGKGKGTVKSHNLGKTKKAKVTTKPINQPKGSY